MKVLTTLLLSFTLFACAATVPADSTQDSDWEHYGFDRGARGWNQESQEQLSRAIESKQIKDTNFQAYLQGYRQGIMEYCEQDAYQLGMKGEIYTGVCDGINGDFKYDYLRGFHANRKDM